MNNRKKGFNRFFAIFFTLIGFFSLFVILKDYGISVLIEEVQRSGFAIVLLVLTFIPTLICYAISWLLVTDHHLMGEGVTIKK